MNPGGLLMLTGLLVAMSVVNAQTEEQNEASVTVSANLDYKSDYLFAGIPFSTGSVLQAGVALGYNGFTVNAFTSYNVDTGEIDERDIFASYYFQYSESTGVYVGAVNYNYKGYKEEGKWDPTYEFNAGLVTSLPGNPELHYSRDFSLTEDGQTIRLTLSHEVPVGAVTFTGSSNIIYNDNYYRIGSNVSHFDLGLSMKAQVGRFTLTPMVTYQYAIADDFENYLVGMLTLQGDF